MAASSFVLQDSVTAPGYSVVRVCLDNIKCSGLATAESRWCVWLAKWREGNNTKPAKVPCDVRGNHLSVKSSAGWLAYEDAGVGYESGPFDGVGLLMESLRGTVGLDLDKCLEADGSVTGGCESIVADFVALGGYIERSPSGRGLRQFLRGVALEDYCENNGAGLEIYDDSSSRYLTMTGQVWPEGSEPGAVIANQTALEAFTSKWGKRKAEAAPLEFDPEQFSGVDRSAEEVLKLLRTYNKRGKITRLLAGEVGGYEGHSEADAALCFEVAYFSRNPEVIDAIQRGSGLMRPKWDDRRGRGTYGQMTIRNALKAQTRNFDADQAAKAVEGGAAKANQEKLAAKGAENIIGGFGDLVNPKGGKVKHNLYALSELMIRDKRLIGCLYWDSFGGLPIVTRSFREAFRDATAPDTVGRLTDCHLMAVVSWVAKEWDITLRPKEEWLIVKRWAQAIRRNPVCEKLDEFEAEWDGKPRLANWLIDYAKAKVITDDGRDITEYVQAVSVRWMVGAVARAKNPGCKMDTMLILEGRQGARKSTLAEALAAAIGEGYFRDGFSLENGKDDRIALQNRLIVEWAELSGMNKKDVNVIKTFMAQCVDPYRSPYGTLEQDHPRSCVFIGTTNESQYLSDPTGNRRFWPVKVGRIDLQAFRRDVRQIWGEAVALWRQGQIWHFDDDSADDMRILRIAEAEQFRRIGGSLWDEVVVRSEERRVG